MSASTKCYATSEATPQSRAPTKRGAKKDQAKLVNPKTSNAVKLIGCIKETQSDDGGLTDNQDMVDENEVDNAKNIEEDADDKKMDDAHDALKNGSQDEQERSDNDFDDDGEEEGSNYEEEEDDEEESSDDDEDVTKTKMRKTVYEVQPL
jgi:hypothetical protein